MEVPIGRAVVVASFNYKCVTEVPAKIEWNGQMKEINTAIVRNRKLTDELMEAFINKAGTAAAVCLVFYKLYPRAHTFKYEGLTDEKSLQFELCSFLSEFNSMKEKLLSGKLAEEINDEARTLFPDSLSSARGLKLTLKIRETITPKPNKRTGKPAAKARSENDKTEHIRGSVRSENTLDDDIDLSKNTTQSTSTTAPTPGASGSSKPTTGQKEGNRQQTTVDFVATESTTQATDFENFDLKFAFQEEDAENYWSRKEYGKAIPFFENILRRSSYKGRHSGVIMLKLSLCKLKLNEVAEGADLYIQGYKQIETDEQSDHTTATQLCEVAKIYAEEDFPRRSFLTFTCIMVIVRRCIEQRRLRVYMDVLSSITPLEKVATLSDKVIEIANSIFTDCQGAIEYMQAEAVRSLCATTIANCGNHLQAEVIFDGLLQRLRPVAIADDGRLALFLQCLYGQSLNSMNLGNRIKVRELVREYQSLMARARAMDRNMGDAIQRQYENLMERVGHVV